MDTILRFPHSREAGAARQQRGHIVSEYQELVERIGRCVTRMQFELSGFVTDMKLDEARSREVASDRIDDLMMALAGDRWADIKRRYDDQGGDVSRMPWPAVSNLGE